MRLLTVATVVLLHLGACAGEEPEAAAVPACEDRCGAHATCTYAPSDPPKFVGCACDEGFAGAQCERCAEGFFGEDCEACAPGTAFADGTCVALCRTGTLDCGPHGACVDAASGPACVCTGGYTGDACDTCATGLQDNDGDGTCRPACVPDGCGRGSCDDTSGEVVCTCDEGYAGSDCSACAEGFQDDDGDLFCAPTCATAELACVHGSCDDASGSPGCVCDEGYAGDDCSACAEGFQDDDGDGICAPGDEPEEGQPDLGGGGSSEQVPGPVRPPIPDETGCGPQPNQRAPDAGGAGGSGPCLP